MAITQDELKELYSYCPDTGNFTRLKNRNKHLAGEIGGCLQNKGFIALKIGKKSYVAHRLAWLYMTGNFPTTKIKHVNGIKTDNRFVNLTKADERKSKEKNKSCLMVDQSLLKEILHYDGQTGNFIWKKTFGRNKSGDVAGQIHQNGYVRISVKGKLYLAHRLVWLYVYGKLPKQCIDHINGIKTDNRIENLREATHQQNMQNRRSAKKNSKTGFLGVTNKRDKFEAKIKVDKKLIHLGTYKTAEAAHQAYLNKKRELHEYSTI